MSGAPSTQLPQRIGPDRKKYFLGTVGAASLFMGSAVAALTWPAVGCLLPVFLVSLMAGALALRPGGLYIEFKGSVLEWKEPFSAVRQIERDSISICYIERINKVPRVVCRRQEFFGNGVQRDDALLPRWLAVSNLELLDIIGAWKGDHE